MLRRLSDEIAGNRPAAVFRHLSENQRLALLILGLLAARLILYTLAAAAAPGGAAVPLSDALCQWDCGWYQDIALNGYELTPQPHPGPTFGQADWPFFPAFALLLRAAAALLPYNDALCGMIVANLFLCVFVYVACLYLRRVAPQTSVPALAVFLFCFPYSLYLSLPYTESLYAALTMLSFHCLVRGKLLPASLVAGLLAATRVTGVLLTPIIAAHFLQRMCRGWRTGGWPGAFAAFRAALLPLGLAPLGLFAFMLYLYLHVGDALAFIHVQRAWQRAGGDPFTVFMNGLFSFDLGNAFAQHTASGTYCALCAIAGALVTARLFSQRRLAECWFLAMSIILPLTHGLPSFPRYLLANPVFMVFLFDAIWSSKYRAFFTEIILASSFLQLWMVQLWTQKYAFLY
jgi:hypothetical protein